MRFRLSTPLAANSRMENFVESAFLGGDLKDYRAKFFRFKSRFTIWNFDKHRLLRSLRQRRLHSGKIQLRFRRDHLGPRRLLLKIEAIQHVARVGIAGCQRLQTEALFYQLQR
jgi:hypothetical protein